MTTRSEVVGTISFIGDKFVQNMVTGLGTQAREEEDVQVGPGNRHSRKIYGDESQPEWSSQSGQ